jgi:hypothetical protein
MAENLPSAGLLVAILALIGVIVAAGYRLVRR